ncbi:MAG: HDOD domain-containing protein [Candidatus Thiodiazotropha sp.]
MQIDNKQQQQLINGIAIPPAPQILIDLQAVLNDPECEIARIAEVITQDIAISALVLRTVNSPFFGLLTKVQSIHHAVSLLGMNNTSHIVAGLALRQQMERSGPNPTHFWDSPLNVAMSMAYLARRFCTLPADEAYMLGLFHNAGHSLLLQKDPQYNDFMDQYYNNPEQPIIHFEQQRYDTDHAILGYYLARSWGIDHALSDIIRDHHDPALLLTGEASQAASVLSLLKLAEHADKIFWGQLEDPEWGRVGHAVNLHLGLSETDYLELRDELNELLIAAYS